MMTKFLSACTFIVIAILFSGQAFGQDFDDGAQVEKKEEKKNNGQDYGYCHLFYLRTDHPEILPFDEDCFVNEIRQHTDYLNLRFVGPSRSLTGLFTKGDWGLTLDLPFITSEGNYFIQTPDDPSEIDIKPGDKQAYLFLSDCRDDDEVTVNYDRVTYRAVGGKIRVHAIDEDRTGSMTDIAYEANMDIYVQQVTVENGTSVLTGPRIRLRASILIKKFVVNGN